MSKKIAAFFNDEVFGWLQSLDFYEKENEFILKEMEDIISRNTVIHIAAKVEVHQIILSKILKKLLTLKKEIIQFKEQLTVDNQLIEDDEISDLIEQEMRLLALNFKQFEQEFIDVKYHCNLFLIDILKK